MVSNGFVTRGEKKEPQQVILSPFHPLISLLPTTCAIWVSVLAGTLQLLPFAIPQSWKT